MGVILTNRITARKGKDECRLAFRSGYNSRVRGFGRLSPSGRGRRSKEFQHFREVLFATYSAVRN
jgi:hypothetical protein